MEGWMANQLLTDVVEATGLPAELITNELIRMIVGAGIDPAQLTLDQLRDVLALHIGDALLQAKEDVALASEKL
jgi:hypothetical protein